MIRNRPPPPGYHWGIKLILALALLFIGAAFLLSQAYQGPTVARLSGSVARLSQTADRVTQTVDRLTQTVDRLAQTSATEKQQTACFDRFTAHVTDTNADALAAMSVELGAIGGLVVTLAAQPRDEAAVQAGVASIFAAGDSLGKAITAYDTASQERANWVGAGRPLPCPIPN